MPRLVRLARPFVLVVAAFAAPAAWADDDVQTWAAVVASGPVRGDLFLWLEGQARLTDDAGGGSQLIARPAIGVRFAREAHAVVGYARVRTDPASGPVGQEDRLWQQVQFAPVRRADGTPLIVSRTRLEQRLFGSDDTRWRLRQFVRFQAPLHRPGGLQAVVYSEGFFNLNAPVAGTRTGIDQWRNFIGIGIPLSPRLRLEPGYLNQYVVRRGPDRMNHVLSATLFIAL